MLNIKTNAKQVISSIDSKRAAIKKAAGKATLKMALKGSSIIKDRTLSGVDYKGNAFIPYSKATLKHKRKRGGHFFNGKVDLTEKGTMLAALQAKKKGNSAVINFVNKTERDKARRHNFGLGNMPKRKFFELSKDERKDLSRMFKDEIKRAIK